MTYLMNRENNKVAERQIRRAIRYSIKGKGSWSNFVRKHFFNRMQAIAKDTYYWKVNYRGRNWRAAENHFGQGYRVLAYISPEGTKTEDNTFGMYMGDGVTGDGFELVEYSEFKKRKQLLLVNSVTGEVVFGAYETWGVRNWKMATGGSVSQYNFARGDDDEFTYGFKVVDDFNGK
jgi:hypothetical protein